MFRVARPDPGGQALQHVPRQPGPGGRLGESRGTRQVLRRQRTQLRQRLGTRQLERPGSGRSLVA